MEDASQPDTAFWRKLQVIPAEGDGFAKTHNHNPFAVLRHKMLSIDHLVPDLVTELFGQCPQNDIKRAAPIMARGVRRFPAGTPQDALP